nr:MAG TPA: Cell wall hydrolase autolysin [Caudoviricetes sp.]
MAKYNVHAGHNWHVTGANGYLNETKEDRIVKDEVIRLLKREGHTVYDCTDEDGRTQSDNLRNIVKKCNAHSVDLDVSIHLNSGGGTGVEVWNYDERTKGVSDRICRAISNEIDIANRGSKYTHNLYVLANTKAPAILVECCFVDSKSDYDAWSGSKCAKAIVEGILGESISDDDNGSDNSSNSIDVKYRVYSKTRRFSLAKWQDEVVNIGSGTDGYAGVIGLPLLGLQANTVGDSDEVGKLMYRLRPLGSKDYWSWQTDREVDKYGETWAGNLKTRYDGIQMHLSGGGDHQVRYRVYCKGKGWLSWITDYGDGADGYAGWRGYEIQAVQIEII